MLITHALDEAAMLSDRVGGDVGAARPPHRDGGDRLAARARLPLVADPAFGAMTGRLWALLRENR